MASENPGFVFNRVHYASIARTLYYPIHGLLIVSRDAGGLSRVAGAGAYSPGTVMMAGLGALIGGGEVNSGRRGGGIVGRLLGD